MKRFLVIFSISLVGLGSFSHCFGKFGLLKTIHSVNGGITIGSGKIAKLIRTLLMLFPFSFLYTGATFLDLILFNLVEFWTDTNPIAKADFNFDGTLVKTLENNGETFHLTYSKWGAELKIVTESKAGPVTLYAFTSAPGKLFQRKNNQLLEVKEMEGPLPPLSLNQL